MLGKTINGFTLQRPLGKGGMAEVWYAENKIHKPAAVKILNEDLSHNATIVERFRNEAEIMVKLKHPNIRQVYDFDEIDGRQAIIMEYLEGNDLKAMMKSGKRFSDAELRRWWDQLVSALNYTHGKGIVHRDIKPGNIFVDEEGNIKLLDFGIAKIKEGISMTQTGAMMGTLIYMSPEQIDDSKRIGPKSDIYSLAVTFVHLLTGRAPYDTASTSDFKIRESIVYKPLDMTGAPADWQTFLKPYLAKDPDERPTLRPFEATVKEAPVVAQPIVEVAVDVASSNVVDEGTVVDEPKRPQTKPTDQKEKPTTETAQKPKGRRGLWIGLGVAILVAVAVLLIMITKPHPKCSISYSGTTMIVNVGDVAFNMIKVEGGTFQMGAQKDNPNGQNYDSDAYEEGSPVHSVTLSTYYIGETEVTQALWEAVMGSNPSCFKGDNLPVEKVSWNDCQKFIRKLNQLTGMNFRLPTEAEWEYAARGGKKSNHYKYAGSSNIEEVAWYPSNSGSKTHPVKGMNPNELGLYDMSGNVWEWCSDWYGSYGSGSQTNPTGPSSGQYRVLRGSSWYFNARYCRVSYRYYCDPDHRNRYNGFRLALIQ